MNAPLAVDVEHLVVRFGRFTAVNDVSFTVARGEIFGFLGANGAGKTTTIRVLCGLLHPTSGNVRVAGLDPAAGLVPIKAKVGYMSQKFTLYDDLTVAQNFEFAAALRGIDASDLARRQQQLFEAIAFGHSPDTLVAELPQGLRQDVSFAAAMLHDPEIVFLDEPTAGVSPAARARFWKLIRHVADAGKTIFVTTHYMDEAEQCGRIALMRDGRLVALDTPAALKERTFKEPLYHLRSRDKAAPDWIERVTKHPSVLSARPYGLSWHVIVADEAGFDRLLDELAPRVEATRIMPSLEDVFIRIVES